jgi:pyruvate, orthophosphate dikinase
MKEIEAMEKHVYTFGKGTAEGDRGMKQLLGGKGANLAEMSVIGLPVPAGFTISTEACHYYSTHESTWPKGLKEQVKKGVDFVETVMDTKFGDSNHPLLLSVRSGAAGFDAGHDGYRAQPGA